MAFFSRMKNSLVGALVGLLLIPGSVCLHAWNEYRTIHRSRGLAEASELVESIAANELQPEKENQLVHLSGGATTEETLVDREFGVRLNAIHLRRQVEMYQWVEKSSRRDGQETYSYDRKWHENRVSSDGFARSGHDNPPLPYVSTSSSAELVKVGAYRLNNTLRDEINNWQPVEMNEDSILETVGVERARSFVVDGGYLFFRPSGLVAGMSDSSSAEEKQAEETIVEGEVLSGEVLSEEVLSETASENAVGAQADLPKARPGDDPQIGDVRIQFQAVLPTDVSLVAMLSGDTFDAFKTSNGETIQRLYVGELSAQQVFEKLMTENTLMAWLLRAGGFALCFGGFSMLLSPLRAMVSWIPILGDLTGFALFIVGALLALIVSLTTIAIAWIAVRPLMGILLLAIVAGACYLIFRMRKPQGQSSDGQPQVIDASMIVE